MKLRHQQGLSLISLLIGLFISMLCILAGMTLYKATLQLSTRAKIDAEVDGQVASVLLTLQQEIQRAGFGIPGADADDVSQFGAADAPVLAWRYIDAGMPVCRGLAEYAESVGGINYRTLGLITAANCTATVDLSTLNWDPTTAAATVIARFPMFDTIATFVGANSLFTFSAPVAAQCSPYGALPLAQHLLVTVRAPSSARMNIIADAGAGAGAGAGVPDHSSTFCLLNTN